MKQLNIKFFIALVLSFAIPSFCWGHDLTELIDKYDFVNFKKAYENSTLSEGEKLELMNKANENIDNITKRLKSYYVVGFSGLNEGKIHKLQIKLLPFFSGGTFGLFNILSIVFFAFLIRQENNNIFNQYNVTAANFAPFAHYVNYAQYVAERDARIRENNKAYWLVGFSSLFGCIFGSFFLYIRNIEKRTLLIYKQWKKAVKIKALMQGSMKEFELLKLGIGGLK